MEVILATANPGKLQEMQRILAAHPVTCLTPEALGGILEIEEDGDTFAENALKKARAYVEWYGKPALADDSGLEVDALDGAPGVHSRRWLGDVPENELVTEILRRMQAVPEEERGAQFRGAMALALPDGRYFIEEGVFRGRIASTIGGAPMAGLPYRRAFYLPEFNKIWSELTSEEEVSIKNHREQALEKLAVQLSDILKS